MEAVNKDLVGKRVELILITDAWTKLAPGDKGTVKSVDDIGTVHVRWDEGYNLGLIPDEDKWRVLPEDS